MYASGVPLASRGLRTSVLYFAWQARDFLLCKGRDVRLWRPSVVSAPLCSTLRGRRATFCSARGVMYAPGVPLASRGLRTSVLYFAWQARDFLLCKGRDVRLWRPSGVPLASRGLRTSVLYFAWQARDFLLCKGRDVRLWRPSGVPWSPHLCALFCVAGTRLSALQGACCTPLASLWRPVVSALFAWQARDFLLCKGRDVRLWRPSGVPWSPRFLRGGRATFCSARGMMYVSGVPLASRGLRAFCVPFCSARGVMYASGVPLASRGLRASVLYFAWQARHYLLCGRRGTCW